MSILQSFLDLTQKWLPGLPQLRTLLIAQRLALGMVREPATKTISKLICANGRDQLNWNPDYRFFSRSPWKSEDLFAPIVEQTLPMFAGENVFIAYDDTQAPRSGKKVPGAQFLRDPQSPAFHVNFMYGLRFGHAAVLLSAKQLDPEDPVAARSFPIRFNHVPPVKKPGKGASEEVLSEYKEAKKAENLSTRFVTCCTELRQYYDTLGAEDKRLQMVVDGSYCNRTCMRDVMDRIELIARVRKNARVCYPDTSASRRFYSQESFTPESVRQDKSVPWQETRAWAGGQMRKVYYKECTSVLWQRGGGRRLLRLIVLRGIPYRTSKNGKTYYREPAYLLATDPDLAIDELIQAYVDRWQIEINHREVKQLFGLADPQVWSEQSVPRQPAFAMASYSLMLWASVKALGTRRTDAYLPLPKWRRQAKRPSALDMVLLMRREMGKQPELLRQLAIFPSEDEAA